MRKLWKIDNRNKGNAQWSISYPESNLPIEISERVYEIGMAKAMSLFDSTYCTVEEFENGVVFKGEEYVPFSYYKMTNLKYQGYIIPDISGNAALLDEFIDDYKVIYIEWEVWRNWGWGGNKTIPEEIWNELKGKGFWFAF